MAAPTLVECDLCHDRVDADTAWQRVVGWERRRRQGGTNHVVLREPQNAWRCRHCMDQVLSGHYGQETLL